MNFSKLQVHVIRGKQGPQGPLKISPIKTLKIIPSPKNTGNVPLNHQKWLPCKILGSETVKKVQIEPLTTVMRPKQLNTP